MAYPVSVKEAIKIEQDVIKAVERAVEEDRLEAAVDIMCEYVSASMCLDMIDDLHDMLNDPDDPVPVPKTPEEYRAQWDAIKVYPTKKGGAE